MIKSLWHLLPQILDANILFLLHLWCSLDTRETARADQEHPRLEYWPNTVSCLYSSIRYILHHYTSLDMTPSPPLLMQSRQDVGPVNPSSLQTNCIQAYRIVSTKPEAGVLNKFSLGGLAKLSRLRYGWLRFYLASAGYRGLGVHDRPVYTAG